MGRHGGTSHGKDDLVVTVSIGGATYPTQCDEVEELIALADQNCLEAKREGKNRVHMAAGENGDWSIAAE